MAQCPKCGSQNDETAAYCSACGRRLPASKTTSNKPLLIIIAVLAVLLLAALAFAVSMFRNGHTKTESNESESDYSITVSSTSPKSHADEEEDDEASDTSSRQVSATAESTVPATAETGTSAAQNGWETAPADKLYRPEAGSFVNQYNAYVFCTDINVQDYVKMRFGPSKTKFNTVGVIIPNYETVTVQTKSVNGWTLCFYQGTEGWIRSDFLFPDRGSIPDSYEKTQADQYACGGEYIVTVTGPYQGEPLNMRTKPSKDSALITKVPDGAWVKVEDNAPVINGWVWIFYQEPGALISYSGYVLYKYLVLAEDVGDKPVLYLYPEKTQAVTVKLDLAESVHFNCTYPAYRNGWSVIARPDGSLTNLADGKEYAYLFWDMVGRMNYSFDSGFVVKGTDTAAFLQKKLAEIGLSPRESNDFIVYWLPRMEKNAYNLISFQSDDYTDHVKLCIQPKPDSTLRVFMAFKKLDAPVLVPPQDFQRFDRDGFTAVEWGGVEVTGDASS